MSLYLKHGKQYSVSTKEALDLHDTLPPTNYVVRKTPRDEIYLEQVDPFTINFKCYGGLIEKSERILKTFMSRPNNTGVMLEGEKGSGKSLLAKLVAIKSAEQGIPTILVNSPLHGESFNTFIQNIEQPCIILFDEFEKVYDKEQQEDILTLLDGVFPSKKLFILTCNNHWNVDINMKNRPGRVFYMLSFKNIEKEFVVEYCNDNLNNRKYINRVCLIVSLFRSFNFDMLKALVEEMNRYDESPDEVLKMLNIKIENEQGCARYSVNVLVDNKIPFSFDKEVATNPILDTVDVYITPKKGGPRNCVEFSPDNIVKLDVQKGYIYRKDKYQMSLTPIKEKPLNYLAI